MKKRKTKKNAPILEVPIVYAHGVDLKPGWVMCWGNSRMHTGIIDISTKKEGPSSLRSREFRLPVKLKLGTRPTITASVYQTDGSNNSFRNGITTFSTNLNEAWPTQVGLRAEQINQMSTVDEVWCEMVAICEGKLIDSGNPPKT